MAGAHTGPEVEAEAGPEASASFGYWVRRYIESGLAIYRTLGDRFDLAAGLNIAAHVRWYGAGDAEESERLYQECLQTALSVENRLDALQGVGGLAFFALARGQWDLAFALQHERLA